MLKEYERSPESMSREQRKEETKRYQKGLTARQQPLPPSGDQSFEDKLKQFLTSSEGKMADLNRSIDGKRGGGRRRR